MRCFYIFLTGLTETWSFEFLDMTWMIPDIYCDDFQERSTSTELVPGRPSLDTGIPRIEMSLVMNLQLKLANCCCKGIESMKNQHQDLRLVRNVR